MRIVHHITCAIRRVNSLYIILIMVGLALFSTPITTHAAGVVGTGTPASCTEAALDTALAGGGTVTFNCGTSVHTIPLTSNKTISASTTVDGGGLITLTGSAYRIEISENVIATFQNMTFDGVTLNPYHATLTVDSVSILNTSTALAGINSVGGDVNINESTFTGNFVGFWSFASGAVITNSTFTGNTAGIQGGFITGSGPEKIVYISETHITNTTISNNTTGGLLNDEQSTANLTNVSILDNGSYGIDNGGTVNLKNSVVAGHTEDCTAIAGQYNDFGGNIIKDTTCNSIGSRLLFPTNFYFRALGDYGGATQTRAFELFVSPTSNEITDCTIVNPGSTPPPNAGSAVTTDQRGAPRSATSCNAGAFEQATVTVEFSAATSASIENDYTEPTLTVTTSDGFRNTLNSDISVTVTGGTASAGGVDYDPALESKLSLMDVENGGTVSVPLNVVDDALVEETETITLVLGNPQGVEIGTQDTHTATILNDDPPSVELGADQSGGEPANITFTVTSAVNVTGNQTVTWTVTGSGENPASAADFGGSFPSSTVTIPDGQNSATFSVTGVVDNTDEPDETYTVKISNPTSGIVLGTRTTATGTLEDEDNPPELSSTGVQILTSSAGEDYTPLIGTALEVEESDVSRGINVPLTGFASYEITVTGDFAGTATRGDEGDYTAEDSFVIAAGESTTAASGVYWSLNPVEDDIVEADETIIVSIASTDPSITDNTNPVTLTLVNDDTATISIADVIAAEDNEDSELSFTLTLSNPVAEPVNIDYALTDGTATGDEDYVSIGGTATFSRLTTETIIRVPIINDTQYEQDETFTLTLSNIYAFGLEDSVSFADDVAIGTITNDDSIPGISVSPSDTQYLTENDGNAKTQTFTFTLESEPSSDVTIPLSLSSNRCVFDPSVSSVTLTSENYSDGVSVTVVAVDNAVADGSANCDLVTGSIISSDEVYAAIEAPDVEILVIDNDAKTSDVNRDGAVSTSDVVYVLNRLGEDITPDNVLADQDRDGDIDEADAQAVMDEIGAFIP